jgi:hypothetical protein
MLTDTFEQERMNAHMVTFGEQEGRERKMFLMGFDEEERGMFVACQAGWPVDMPNEQVEVLNGWYQNILDELSRRANRQNVPLMAGGNIRAPERRRRSLTPLGALLLLQAWPQGSGPCTRLFNKKRISCSLNYGHDFHLSRHRE